MKRRILLTFLTASIAMTTAARADQPSLRAKLLGLWTLTEAVTVEGDNIRPWYGRRAPISGAIVFLDSGWISVQIGGSRPDKVARGDFPKLAPAERLAFFEQYYAFYGTFEIDEKAGAIQYHVTDSLLPFERGDILKRQIDIKGNTLTLVTEPRTESGKTHFNRLTWRKKH